MIGMALMPQAHDLMLHKREPYPLSSLTVFNSLSRLADITVVHTTSQNCD